jgi:hypothetical protein
VARLNKTLEKILVDLSRLRKPFEFPTLLELSATIEAQFCLQLEED